MQTKTELPIEFEPKDPHDFERLKTFRVRGVLSDLGKEARNQSNSPEERLNAVTKLGEQISSLDGKNGFLGYDLSDVRQYANAQLFAVITKDPEPAVRIAAINALDIKKSNLNLADFDSVRSVDVITYALVNGVPAEQTKEEIIALTCKLNSTFCVSEYSMTSLRDYASPKFINSDEFAEKMKDPLECLRLNGVIFTLGRKFGGHPSAYHLDPIASLLFDPRSPLTDETRIGLIEPLEQEYQSMKKHHNPWDANSALSKSIYASISRVENGMCELAHNHKDFSVAVTSEAQYALSCYRGEDTAGLSRTDISSKLDNLKQPITFGGQPVSEDHIQYHRPPERKQPHVSPTTQKLVHFLDRVLKTS